MIAHRTLPLLFAPALIAPWTLASAPLQDANDAAPRIHAHAELSISPHPALFADEVEDQRRRAALERDLESFEHDLYNVASLSPTPLGALRVNESLRLEYGRREFSTIHAGPSGVATLTPNQADPDALQSSTYNVYDLTMSWDVARRGPVSLAALGGVRAVHAGAGGEHLPFDHNAGDNWDSSRLVPVAVAGGRVRWAMRDRVYLQGSGLGHTHDQEATFLDLSAELGYELSPNTGFSFGYRRIESRLSDDRFDAEANTRAFYVRFGLKF